MRLSVLLLAILNIGFSNSIYSFTNTPPPSIFGPSTGTVGNTDTYSYTDFGFIGDPYWTVTGGTITNQYFSGGTYYADILWTSAGSRVVKFYDGGFQLGSKNVTVSGGSPPATPTLTTATGLTSSSFIANWTVVAGATSYVVDVATNTSFNPRVYTDLVSTMNSKSISGLQPNTTYYYRVAAVNSSGTSGESSYQTIKTYTNPPTNTTSTNVTSSSFTANWGTVIGATSYLLDVSTESNFSSFVSGYQNYPLTTTSKVINNLPIKPKYYFRVRAVNSAGPSGYSNVVVAIDNDQNYIRTMDVLVVGKTTITAVESGSISERAPSYTFVDGLGRPIQTVSVQASPSPGLKDIVQPIAYDAYGRESKKYLPFTAGSNEFFRPTSEIIDANGDYKGVAQTFYAPGSNNKVADDSKPFSEIQFESSPLNRPHKQFGPGEAWRTPGSEKFVENKYLVNVHGTGSTGGVEKIIAWDLDGSGHPIRHATVTNYILAGGYYNTGQLFINITIDEQGNSVREYSNKQGQVILKKVQVISGGSDLNNVMGVTPGWALTYYIYDELGNLRYVLPPELSKLVHVDNSKIPSNTPNGDLDTWAFQYKYDARNRMTEKKVPGAAWIYMVYDKRDRLILTQDGNQRKTSAGAEKKEWMFTKYDMLNRPVLTGIYEHTDPKDQPEMQAIVDGYYNSNPDNMNESYSTSAGNVHKYTNISYPTVNDPTKYLTITYYDHYDFKTGVSGLGYFNNDYTGQPTGEFLRVNGLVTGTKVKILESVNSDFLYGVNYYDSKYRSLQTISQNHKSGTDRTTNKYDFVGNVLESKRTYLVSGVSRYIWEVFTYDHFNRLLTVIHYTDNATTGITVVKNEYNELGKLVDKQLHSTDGTNFKQSVDYRYNIRGWLTKINESDIGVLPVDETLGDYFGMELGYNNMISGITTTPAYNGNISAVKWSTGAVGGSNLQGNAYNYDALNRLETTSHYKDELLSGWINDDSNLETGFKYDLNGNIKELTRKGEAGVSIDILTYDYTGTGNRLNYVHDTGDPLKGFINGNTGVDDYAYDLNGNLIKDKNKGINNDNDIKYNHLNLPIEILKGADKIKYFYDATGRKLYQELYIDGSVTKTTDYVGELIFEGTTTPILQFINHAEGRVLPDGAGWEYQYHLKDHLGNVRVTFTSKTPTPLVKTATFETGTQSAEQSDFNNYSSITYDLVDKTDAGTAYQKVQFLNGGVNGRVGLAKSYTVMPGDKIKAEVYAKYRNLTTNGNATSFITALATAFGTSSGATGELGKLYDGLESYASEVPGGDHDDDDENAPKAFITILLFDKNYNLVNAAWDQIDVSAHQTSGTVKTPPTHDYMMEEMTVSEAGYAYVFLSNEHPTYVEVYYDDVKLTHTPSPVIAVNDYYPFGLSFNSYSRENTTPNQFKFNGKEEQDELDLGWLDYGARMYQPEIGRFFVQDALADFGSSWTPYRYAFNNPVNIIDPDGNYEINVTLSKEEQKQLKGIEDKKERRAERAKLIESKKQVVRDFVASAKGVLDNNAEAKDAFVAFSGIKEGSKEWDNLWTENGKGPTLVSDGNLEKKDVSGWAMTGTIGFNPNNELGQNVLSTLHEYVHYGDELRTLNGGSGYENTPNGVPGYDAEKQREALNEAYEKSSNDPDPQRRVTQSQWNSYYGSYYTNGKVSGVELGYGYEKAAFGRVYTTSQDYKEFTAKYLNKK